MAIILVLLIFSQDLLESDIELSKETIVQEVLEELSSNPLDINTAGYDELIKIPYLTPINVYQILQIREIKGSFRSVSELLEIAGFDRDLLDNIEPFIKIEKPKIARPLPAKIQGQIQTKINLDSLKNISQTDEWEITTRLKFLMKHLPTEIEVICLTAKDAQEKSLVDYSSSSISITTKNNRVLLGNYTMNFGAQQIFAGPYSYLNPSKDFTLEPYRALNAVKSVYNYPTFFGLGYFQRMNNLGIYAFLSSTYLSAAIKDGYVQRVYYYTKFIDSTTIARRNQLRADLIGLRLNYHQPSLSLGLTAYHHRYDKPFAPRDSTNSFYGSKLNLLGGDFQSHLGNYFLRSELGYSLNGGLGASGQIIGNWRYLKVKFEVYAQQKNFFSPYSRWKSLTNRKDQIYAKFNIYYNLLGFKMYLSTNTKQDWDFDSLPSRLQFRINRAQDAFQINLVLKRNYKETNLTTYGTQLDFSYQGLKNLQLLMRIEDRYVKNLPRSGRLFSWGAKFSKRYFQIESRVSHFNINSSDCKIYVYESGPQGIGRNYAFNKKGIRIFSSFESNLFRYLKIAGRVGFTKIPAESPISPDTHRQNFDSAIQLTIKL